MTPRVLPSPRLLGAAAALLLALACGAPARAQIRFTVSFDDPSGAHAAYYDVLRAHALAAGGTWAGLLVSTAPSSLEVLIGFPADVPRATGRSLFAPYVATHGGIHTYEQGAAAEVRTGVDPNREAPDIEINFGGAYLTDELWFDPDPQARTADVPGDRVDAQSVLLHEFGHAFSFNGWRDGNTGLLPGDYQSTFDRQISVEGGIPFFRGANAMAVYGGAVPLTVGNASHLGNDAPRPGSDLIPDLMNGVAFFRGQRYGISQLDLAITQDSGLPTLAFSPAPVAVPEPGTAALLAGPVLLWLARVGRGRRRPGAAPMHG